MVERFRVAFEEVIIALVGREQILQIAEDGDAAGRVVRNRIERVVTGNVVVRNRRRSREMMRSRVSIA
jgi:hypothetical protein